MDDQLGRRVRDVYVRLRGERRPGADARRTPAAILDVFLRGLDEAERPTARDPDAPEPTAALGAFIPPAAKRALAIVGKPYASGALIVSDGARDLALIFAPSGLKAALLGGRFPSLAKRLADTQRLDAAQLQRLEQTRARFRSEAEALVTSCGVAPEVAAEGAGELVGQAFLDALFWEAPCFEALALDDAGAALLQRRDVDALVIPSRSVVKTLVAGLTERVEQLAPVVRSIHSPRAPLAATAKGSAGRTGQLTPRQSELLEATTSGTTTLADLAEAEGNARRPLHVLAADLHELAQRHLVSVGEAPKTVEAPNTTPEAGLSPLARRLRQAKVAVDAGDRRRSSRALARVGGALLEQRRAPEAVRCFGAARALAPTDLEAHDGLVRALVDCERREEALVESEELVRHYLDSHLPARARRVAQRLLPGKEDPATQLLLVEAALALGEQRAAVDLGERLVSRLRQDGKKGEAQALADALVEASGGAGAVQVRRLARGTGLASPLAGRLSAALVLGLGVGVYLAVSDWKMRRAYAHAVKEAQNQLQLDPLDVEGARAKLAIPLAGRAGQAAKKALDQLDVVASERDGWRALQAALGAPTLEERLAGIDALRPRTKALEVPVEAARAAVLARRSQVEQQVAELQGLVARNDMPRALAAAQHLLRSAPDARATFGGATLPIRVTTTPVGAVLRWGGTSITHQTPFEAQLPLLEERQMDVSLAGHRTSKRRVSVLRLEATAIHVTLQPLAPGEADVPVDETRAEVAGEGGGELTLRDGVMQGGVGAFTFPPPPADLLGLRLPEGERGRVDLVHELEGGAPRLVRVRVTLERHTADGWKAEQPVSFAPAAPIARAVDGGKVGPLQVDRAWLREKVEKALAFARSRGQGGRE